MRRTTLLTVTMTALLILSACPAKQEGAIEGTVSPPNVSARITAFRNGTAAATVDVNTPDGRFSMPLAPGVYDVSASAPSSPFPMTFPGVVVEPGKATALPPIELSPSSSTAVLSGKITPGGADTQVKLIYEGKERAAAHTDSDGKYEFIALPAGRYAVEASSPGYAADTAELNLAENQRAAQNVRLLYVTAVDGVDWGSGTIRATGMGLPPKNSPNATVRREMAKRAALADGERNLLKIIDQLKVGPSQTVQSALGKGKYVERIQGFIRGYHVTAERELNGGGMELDLELPLTGRVGLSSYIRDN